MAIKIQNLRISPYTAKDTLKVVFGDQMELTFAIPHVDGESYMCGLDNERVVYPPSRPICAYTSSFTRDGDNVTFKLNLTTSKLRTFVSGIKKPMPVWVQVVREVNGKYETVLLDDILALPSVIDGAMTVCEGDPLKELLEAKMDKPYDEGTEGQVLTMGEDGHYAWADLPEIPEQEQADWTETDSSEVSYIRNKPDLSIYVEKEAGKGLSSNDFTNADKAKLGGIENGAEVNVQADWDVSESGDDAYIKHKPALSTVALTGSYADLSNKPDLTVYSLVTETGNKITMSIDDEYDLVVNLLDKNDNILSTQDIDLPIESMIVDATYANGVLTLTLQNGNTVDVDISDIVSGLVPDSRTVNGHALSSDVTVTAQDLGLATVATSGSYTDLTDKPHIPADQVQSDWDESDSSEVSYILNKPNVEPSIDELITFFEGIYHDDSSSASESESESESASGSDTPSGATDPFTITLADPTKTQGIRLYRQITTTNWDMQYSYDGNSWISISWEAGANFSSTIRIGHGYAGNKVYLRGNNNTNYVATSDYFVFNTIDQTSATAVKLSGNLYSIFRRTGFEEITDITTIGTFGQYGCYSLFRNTDGGGKYLFNCIDAGDLYMNATTLQSYLCDSMFRGSSITRAPYLPATSVSNYCYNGMFRDCTSLKEISVAFTSWTSATSGWVNGVGSTGTFKCPSGLNATLTGANYVPSGWTVENI